ncbi:MAG: hypothetical protein ACI4RO_01945 [Candidatus Scatosoma sp.]
MKRTVIASVVAATLLVVTLLAVIIYQIVSIAVTNNRIEKAQEEIESLQEIIDRQNGDLDYYTSLLGREQLAHSKGLNPAD